MISFRILALAAGLWAATASADTPLKNAAGAQGLVDACPFNRGAESVALQALEGAIHSLLETKLEGNERCRAPFHGLHARLGVLNAIGTRVSGEQASEIVRDRQVRYRQDLLIQLASLEARGAGNSPQAEGIRTTLDTVEGKIVDADSDARVARAEHRSGQESAHRHEMLTQANQLLGELRAMDPRCMEAMGGWSGLTPSLLGVASAASGSLGFPGQAIVSAGLQIFSNLAAIFSDRRLKRAVNDVNNLQNERLLACAYYALKDTACDFAKAMEFASDVPRIRQILRREFPANAAGDFQRLLWSFGILDRLRPSFNLIAEMGTPLSLDLTILNKYLQAQAARVYDVPAAPPGTASNAEKRRWIQRLGAEHNLRTPEENYNSGQPLSLDEQIKSLQTVIANLQGTIETVTAILTEKRSFEDLRHELDRREDRLLGDMLVFEDMLRSYRRQSPTNGIPRAQLGALDASISLVTKLREYLEVSVDQAPGCAVAEREIRIDLGLPVTPMPGEPPIQPESRMLATYRVCLNRAGTRLFGEMARGAVAQLTGQSVLAVGSKAIDRIERSLSIIENTYVRADLAAPSIPTSGYTSYKRAYDTEARVAFLLAEYGPLAQVFNPLTIQASLDAFELGFEKEIRRMVERALRSGSELVPELRGAAAPHLCSLFASSLAKTREGQVLLQQCRARAATLPQYEIVRAGGIPVEFGQGCFYPSYVSTLEMQETLIQELVEDSRL